MQKLLITLGIIVAMPLMIGGGLLLKALWFPVNTVQKETGIAYDAQNRVLNADNAIYNYEWFKQQYEDIQAGKKKLDNATQAYLDFRNDPKNDPANWTFEDKQEDSRLRTIKLGLENHLEQMIADYNARSKQATRNIFIDGVLPDYIDALTFIRK